MSYRHQRAWLAHMLAHGLGVSTNNSQRHFYRHEFLKACGGRPNPVLQQQLNGAELVRHGKTLSVDFLVLDLAHAFAPGGFLEIERSLIDNRPHNSAGGRWLEDDILDELLTLMVNGGRGERFGDGVDAPTKPASLTFPYVREPNNRTDLPLPAFLRG